MTRSDSTAEATGGDPASGDETTDAAVASSEGSDSNARWSLLGVGGAVSLCCLFAGPAATGAAGGAVAGGTTAALGGGLVRILVSALTVGVVGVALRYRLRSCACED